MSDRPSTSVERLFAAALYAPIGLGAQLVDDVPRAVSKARQQIVLARFLGKMVVDQGSKALRDRLESGTGQPTPSSGLDVAGEMLVATEPPDRVGTDDSDGVGSTKRVADRDVSDDVSVDDIALPDYDQLPAAHIVGKLAGLTQGERNQIERYELAHRHRRTVLGKLDQVRVDDE